MYIRALALLTIATALSGCFASEEEIWPVKGGMNLLLPDGEYACTHYNAGRPFEYNVTVKLITEGNNFYYEVTVPEELFITASFYKIREDLYIVSALDHEDGKYKLQYARVIGHRVITFDQTDEEANAAADSLGVNLEHDHLLNTGTIDERRAFIIGVGENLSTVSVERDCKPVNS